MRADAASALLLATLMAVAGPGAAQDAPVSAIPWLSDSLRQPEVVTPEEPAATPLTRTEISVQELGAVRRDAVGLIPAATSGLPRDAVAGSEPARVAALMAAIPVDTLPAMQELVLTLLLAELDPPRATADPDALFLARIDTLLRLGALDQAQALLERAGAADRRAFRRWFDASLLTGDDTRACEAMAANPGIAPTLPARIFCLARADDWIAAALTLDTGRAIGAITEEEDALLAHFLDPELFEGEPPPIPPRPMTPLAYRLLDGIGETPATRDLPLAFAVADLRPNVGWKAQIEAAERLVRAGVLDPNLLLALYTDQRPSASGGVWDRAAAVQKLDAALVGGDHDSLAAALDGAIAEMEAVGMLVPLAALYGERVARALPGNAAAERLGLLAPNAPSIAEAMGDSHAFARALALGEPLPDATEEPHAAIARGFAEDPPTAAAALLAENRAAEALLDVVRKLSNGGRENVAEVTGALATLRAAGMEPLARRTALQILLLE